MLTSNTARPPETTAAVVDRKRVSEEADEADDSQLPIETEQEEEADNKATRGVTIPLFNGSESRSVIAKRLKG